MPKHPDDIPTDPLEGLPFEEVIYLDFEFHPKAGREGNPPDPVCLAFHEARSGRTVRLWRDQLGPRPLFRTDDGALVVSFFATAELDCFLQLGWELPAHVLDLYTELRVAFNGRIARGYSLLRALQLYGVEGIESLEKEEMRNLILSRGPWTEEQKQEILVYCESDVIALRELLPRMLPEILARPFGLQRALYRGRYMAAVSRVQAAGVPIDTVSLERLRANWEAVQLLLIAETDPPYGVHEDGHFRRERFAALVRERGMARIWPRTDDGYFSRSDAVLKDMALIDAYWRPLRELLQALSELKMHKLAVGDDGHNRALLSPFRSKTGRNQPSTSKFIFGLPAWMRSLIKPPSGQGLAYVDWTAQEVGIAAALSGDQALLAAYETGDVHLAFAKRAGLVPEWGTKSSHSMQREKAKVCTLGMLYGMKEKRLGLQLGISEMEAAALIRLHQRTFPRFWEWSDQMTVVARLTCFIQTFYGWAMRVDDTTKQLTLLNFPMQAHGAELMRQALILAVEKGGLRICCPVHDAFLIQAPVERLDDDVAKLRMYMAEASRRILRGFELRSEGARIVYPARYADPRGEHMWSRVMKLLDVAETLAG